MTVVTRASSESQVLYPLCVYAFDMSGRCRTHQLLESDEDKLSLSLEEGQYHLLVLSGIEDVVLPKDPHLSDAFTLPDECQHPVLMGQADVTVGTGNTKVYVLLSYAVCSVQCSLSDVPQEVQNVWLEISGMCSKWSFDGKGIDPGMRRISLSRDAQGMWISEKIYLLPGGKDQTVMTVRLTMGEEDVCYGYTYDAPLIAGTPYTLAGHYYNGMVELTGEFEVNGWSAPVDIDFNFGPSVQQKQEAYKGLPGVGCVWEGHVVALVDTLSETSADVLLLSLQEWDDVHSAYHSEVPTEALDLVLKYSEEGLSDWDIPSEEQAKRLRNQWPDDALEALNDTLLSCGASPIELYDEAIDPIRYLCEAAKKTFCFLSDRTISKAGTQKGYRLRAVKTMRIELKSN